MQPAPSAQAWRELETQDAVALAAPQRQAYAVKVKNMLTSLIIHVLSAA